MIIDPNNRHPSAADPSFKERLASAIECAKILATPVDTAPLLKKKYKRYHIGIDMRKDTFYRSSKHPDRL